MHRREVDVVGEGDVRPARPIVVSSPTSPCAGPFDPSSFVITSWTGGLGPACCAEKTAVDGGGPAAAAPPPPSGEAQLGQNL